MAEVVAGPASRGIWCNGNSLSCLVHDDFHGRRSSRTVEVDPDHINVQAESPAEASDSGVKPGASDDADKARKEAGRIRTLQDKAMAADPFQQRLASDVTEAVEEMASLRSSLPAFRRAVASRLREGGYDAAVCQTRWPRSQEVAAGNYEFIDVVTVATSGKSAVSSERRYIVDVGFAMEFVVARPTAAYAVVLAALPTVLVARPKVVQQVVKVAAKAARRSLKSQGLTVPPWRKKRFMAAKWLGPYRRTPDKVMAPPVAAVAASEAICRIVGFVLQPSVPRCVS